MKQLAIIIPAYKETFLRKALESIASQTCKDFTLYIGDDCSPYDLKSIVSDFTDKIDIVYKRFDTNLGGKDLVAQWERCVNLSNAEPYIWLFSDDDIMEPRCVEKFIQLSDYDKNNYLIHFDITVINGNGDVVKQQEPYPKIQTAIEYLDGKLFEKRNISYVVEFVLSRSLYEKCGGFQKFDLAWGSDFITWLKVAGVCNGIMSIAGENCRVKWRSSDQNISPNKSKPILLRKLNSTIESTAYIKKWLILQGFRYSFKYSKYVWGEIRRNRKLLNNDDIKELSKRYGQSVGHCFLSFLSSVYVRFLCR